MISLRFKAFILWGILPFFLCIPAAADGNDFSWSFVPDAVPKTGEYVLYVEANDWGASYDMIVLRTKKTVYAKDIRAEDFEVELSVRYKSGIRKFINFSEDERDVSEAFLSDEYGNAVQDEKGRYVTLKFNTYPEEEYSSPFAGGMFSDCEDLYAFEIENDELDFKTKKCTAVVNKKASEFKTALKDYNGITLRYSSWIPPSAGESKKVPLIVWFHGIGEGGQNPYKPLMGPKALNLSEKKIQAHFANGAAVLAPVCPTSWLETTEEDKYGGRYWVPADVSGWKATLKEKVKSFLDTGEAVSTNVHEAVSYYSEAAKNLIQDFLKENPQVDSSRVYLTGASAGGFMALNMLFLYPELFAAVVDCCGMYPDSRIAQKDIETIAKKPVWFVYAENDQTATPSKMSGATYDRVMELNPKNVHVSAFEKVFDPTGLYKNQDGTPFEYEGHYSWVYLFNDLCFDGSLNLFDWLSKQRL